MSEKDFTIMHSRNMQQVSVTQRITKVLTLFITYAFLIVMALIVLFPFSRLVHIWSAPVEYLTRKYQVVRARR